MDRRALFFALFALVVVSVEASAQASERFIPYRGHLELDGAPVNGPFEIVFALYPTPTGGSPLASATHTVQVSDGSFAVDIGPIAESAFDSPGLYLELVVEGVTLATRQQIRAVPYAVRGEVGKVMKAERVEFPATTTDKLTLWSDGGASTSYGVGIGPGQLRTFVPSTGRFTVGTGSGTTFVDGVTLRPNGAIESPRFKATDVIYDTDLTGGSTSAQFTTSGGTLLIFASASAFRAGSGGDLLFDVRIDGVSVGEIRGNTNEVSSHKTLVSRALVVPNVAAGTRTLTIIAVGTTLTDLNDIAAATVVELPF